MPEGIRRQSLLTADIGLAREWYFGFCANVSELPWYQRFAMRRDSEVLRHVYTFAKVGDTVLFVEPYRNRIDFTVKQSPNCVETAAQEISDAGHLVLHHTFEPEIGGKSSLWNIIPSCVTVVKVSTGYASYARTPKQLFNCLLNNGAKVIMPKDIDYGWEAEGAISGTKEITA